jgi:hypothetical protein
MAALIDSSVFIAGERGRIDLVDPLVSLRGGRALRYRIPAVTRRRRDVRMLT